MRKFFEFAFGLIILITLVALAGYSFIKLANFLTKIDKTLASTIIAGLITLFSILFAFWKDREKARREAHRNKKVEIYSVFSKLVFEILRGVKTNEDEVTILSERFKTDMYVIMEGILFYGSPKVIKAYSNWMKNTTNEEQSSKELLSRIGEVFLAMRADLGLSNSGLNSLSIHQIYVNEDLEASVNQKRDLSHGNKDNT